VSDDSPEQFVSFFRKLLADLKNSYPTAVVVWLGASRLWRYSDEQISQSPHLLPNVPAQTLRNLRKASNRVKTFYKKMEKANVFTGQEKTVFARNVFSQLDNHHILDRFGHLSLSGNQLIASKIEPLMNSGNILFTTKQKFQLKILNCSTFSLPSH
jgi:hypothetical protein